MRQVGKGKNNYCSWRELYRVSNFKIGRGWVKSESLTFPFPTTAINHSASELTCFVFMPSPLRTINDRSLSLCLHFSCKPFYFASRGYSLVNYHLFTSLPRSSYRMSTLSFHFLAFSLPKFFLSLRSFFLGVCFFFLTLLCLIETE